MSSMLLDELGQVAGRSVFVFRPFEVLTQVWNGGRIVAAVDDHDEQEQ